MLEKSLILSDRSFRVVLDRPIWLTGLVLAVALLASTLLSTRPSHPAMPMM